MCHVLTPPLGKNTNFKPPTLHCCNVTSVPITVSCFNINNARPQKAALKTSHRSSVIGHRSSVSSCYYQKTFCQIFLFLFWFLGLVPSCVSEFGQYLIFFSFVTFFSFFLTVLVHSCFKGSGLLSKFIQN